MTVNEYKKQIRAYLQSSESTDEVWEYVLDALCHVAATMGMDFLEESVFGERITKLENSE